MLVAFLLSHTATCVCASEVFLDFDIPAASLDHALSVFGATTREQLLIDATITDGRRSNAVKGKFTAEAALLHMLEGSGLSARAVDGRGFTIIPFSQEADVRSGGAVSATVRRFDAYSGLIQAAMARMLCGRPETSPGGYRAVARIWIDSRGSVDRAELLTSSGEVARDALLTADFQGLLIGAPPTGLPQPVTLLVTSVSAGSEYCTALRMTDPTRRDLSR